MRRFEKRPARRAGGTRRARKGGHSLRQRIPGRASAAVLAAGMVACTLLGSTDAGAQPDRVPTYRVDPAWPAPLPENWILGQVAGIAVGRDDHVWIVQRPRSLTEHEAGAVQNPPTADCCAPAPAVIELDRDGRFVQGWGGPRWDQATAMWIEPEEPWPSTEHGIFVDAEDNVWIAGNGEGTASDHLVIKFSRSGERLLTIGVPGETGGSNDVERLGRPADVYVDTAAREVYVADGYGNRRVIVFDSTTGAYKRHWGAYGERPDDGPLPPYSPDAAPARSFRGPVHAVVLSPDRLLYVADRASNRIQVFRPDGEYVTEGLVAPWTLSQGSIWDLEISPYDGGRWLFVADGHNKKLWIVERESLTVRGSIGRGGRQTGQFEWVHNLAADSAGNLYTAEVNTGKRVQRFLRVGSN